MLPDLAAEWERDFKGTFGKISTLNLGKFNHRHKDLVTFNSDTEATKFDKPFRGQD